MAADAANLFGTSGLQYSISADLLKASSVLDLRGNVSLNSFKVETNSHMSPKSSKNLHVFYLLQGQPACCSSAVLEMLQLCSP